MQGSSPALTATPRQIAYARSLALRNQTSLPEEVRQDPPSMTCRSAAQV